MHLPHKSRALAEPKDLDLKFNRTFGRVINAAHDVEQRRLTGPIGTDQTTDLAFLDIERCRVQSGNSPNFTVMSRTDNCDMKSVLP